jgi:hypothetical protein
VPKAVGAKAAPITHELSGESAEALRQVVVVPSITESETGKIELSVTVALPSFSRVCV